LRIRLKNIKIYGESLARDCLVENECASASHDGCKPRNGLMIGYYSTAGKDVLPDSESALPIHKIKKDGSYGGLTTYDGVQFIDFNSTTTWCGATQKAIVLNPYAADYIPITKFKNTRFENVNQNALAFLFSPP